MMTYNVLSSLIRETELMSAFGTKQTSELAPPMSAFGGKADTAAQAALRDQARRIAGSWSDWDFQFSARKSRMMSNFERRRIFGVLAGGAGSIWMRTWIRPDRTFRPARTDRERRVAPVGGLFAGNKLPMRFPGTRGVNMDGVITDQIQHKPTVYRTVGGDERSISRLLPPNAQAQMLSVTCHMLRHSPSHVRRPILGASVTSHVTPPYKV